MGHGDLGNEKPNKWTPTLLRMRSVNQGQAVGFSGSPFLIWKMRREPPQPTPWVLGGARENLWNHSALRGCANLQGFQV